MPEHTPLSLGDWVAENFPDTDLGSLSVLQMQGLATQYQTYLDNFAPDVPDEKTVHPDSAYQAYLDAGGTLSYEQWNFANKPASGEGPDYDGYLGQIITDDTGTWRWTGASWELQGEVQEETVDDTRTQEEIDYQAYLDAGGTLPLDGWRAEFRPMEESSSDGGGGTIPGAKVYQNAQGRWVHDLNDTIWDNESDALADYNAAVESQGFQQELATSVEEWQEEIARVERERAAEGKRISARNIGKLSTDTRNALMASGVAPAEIDQLLAGGIEGGQRSLNDLLTQIGLSTKQELARASQFGIGTQLDAEKLGQAQQSMLLGQSRHAQSLAEDVRQFDQRQQQQASQFASSLDYNRWATAGGWDVQRDRLAADVDQWGVENNNQPSKWSGFWSNVGSGAGLYTAAKIGSKLVPGVQAIPWCFDGSVMVSNPDGFVAISLLKEGDIIKTGSGLRPVLAVHEYERHSDMVINGVKVTKTHPFVKADGSLELSGNLKMGDRLWGGVEVTELQPHEGMGKVYNLDVPGHTFYLKGDILVHTGRDQDAI